MTRGVFNPRAKRKEGFTIDFTLNGKKRKGKSLFTKKGATGRLKKLKADKKKKKPNLKGVAGFKIRKVF